MALGRDCDMCGRRSNAENPIMAKLYFTPLNGEKPADHSSYNRHMDVGKCCITKVSQWGWQKRKSKKEGAKSRKLRAVADEG